jgi:hypothetical protein
MYVMNDGSESILEEAVMLYFKVLSWDFLKGLRKTIQKLIASNLLSRHMEVTVVGAHAFLDLGMMTVD